MMERKWYELDVTDSLDSPALLFYPDRIRENIRRLLERIKPQQLRPHVKTNKTAEVCAMMLEAGITKFKAATIAELEMLGSIGAPDVLLAYPVNGPKIKRLIRCIQKFPDTKFSCLADQPAGVKKIAELFASANLEASVFIDLNIGMNRTGIVPERAVSLFEYIHTLPAVKIMGLHAYDGHIKDPDLQKRTENCNRSFEPVLLVKKELEKRLDRNLVLVAGGTPTCFIHAAAGERECSPGTFVFWDKGYTGQLPEQPFEWAAALFCRIIAVPAPDKICVDLGYKSVASENPLPRVYFMNLPNALALSHSEEHLVLQVSDASAFQPGDILYGIPWHICPTVALYDEAIVVEDHQIRKSWKVIARKRTITV